MWFIFKYKLLIMNLFVSVKQSFPNKYNEIML